MEEGDLPREVAKPWGSELWYAHTDRYAGKILRVSAGHKLTPELHDVVRVEDRYGRSGTAAM